MAYQGIDLRDLYRRGSGMTPRRLWVLIRALPADAPLWVELQEAEKNAYKAPDLLRERQAAFEARNAARLAQEADNG